MSNLYVKESSAYCCLVYKIIVHYVLNFFYVQNFLCYDEIKNAFHPTAGDILAKCPIIGLFTSFKFLFLKQIYHCNEI